MATRNQLSNQNKTITSYKNHKDPNKTKKNPSDTTDQKSTIEKFKNLTKKSIFLRKRKTNYIIHPNTQKQQKINVSLIISDQENNATFIIKL